jgi:hypothetical protein
MNQVVDLAEELSRSLHLARLPGDVVEQLLLRAYHRGFTAAKAQAARIVQAGGDGKDRLETAIACGTNAAIAEAIMEMEVG